MITNREVSRDGVGCPVSRRAPRWRVARTRLGRLAAAAKGCARVGECITRARWRVQVRLVSRQGRSSQAGRGCPGSDGSTGRCARLHTPRFRQTTDTPANITPLPLTPQGPLAQLVELQTFNL